MFEVKWEDVAKWMIEHGTRILIIVGVGVLLWFVLDKFLSPIVRRGVARSGSKEDKAEIEKRTKTLLAVVKGVGRVFIVIIGLVMVLSEVEIDVGPMLAGLGIAGIAIGFGAQYLIRDLIAGIFIILENQYRVGDVIRIAEIDIGGQVEEITLRKTVLRDLDGIVHHIPNGEVRVASNYTKSFARVNLNISVAYNTDLDHAICVINRVGKELAEDEKWREVIKSSPQVLRVNNLGENGIDIKIVGDVKPMEHWAVMGELRLRLKKAFDAEGIEIAWPRTKVYFDNPLPEPSGKKD